MYVLDQYNACFSNSILLKRIKDISPDIIGISCITVAMKNIKEITASLRKYLPDSKIVCGNVHASVMYEDILCARIADVVIRKEADITFVELAEALRDSLPLSSVEGIAWRNNGEVILNSEREQVRALDTLPIPAWHLFDLSLYTRNTGLGLFNKPMLPITASRGCSFKCFFCSHSSIFYGMRIREIKKVVDEIEYLYEKFSIKHFLFVDTYFPFSIESGFRFVNAK